VIIGGPVFGGPGTPTSHVVWAMTDLDVPSL
jgi:hypothetical protein